MIEVVQPADIDTSTRALQRVFANTDPFDAPFRREVEKRALLYPVPFDFCEWSVLRSAAEEVGDRACYLRHIDRTLPLPPTWMLAMSDYESYREIAAGLYAPFEVVLYSSQGKWGILQSYETNHALVGGPAEFIQRVVDEYPVSQADCLREFFVGVSFDGRTHLAQLSEIPKFPELHWLSGMLSHVYGDDEAQKLVEAAGLS